MKQTLVPVILQDETTGTRGIVPCPILIEIFLRKNIPEYE